MRDTDIKGERRKIEIVIGGGKNELCREREIGRNRQRERERESGRRMEGGK